MMKKMRGQSVHIAFLLVLSVMCGSIITIGAATLAEQCSSMLTKVTECLNFATGKAATPSKDCCSAVSSIRDSQPVCLCYFIQQAHNGSTQIRNLGIQEVKLLQLPSACNLVNASVSNCPKLLNLSPNSSDYVFFTNSSASNASTTTPTTSNDSSDGFKQGPHLAAPVAIAVALFFYAFPAAFASTFNTRW